MISENERAAASHDFDLGIAGFRYSDLFDAVRLADLAEAFYNELDEREPVVGEALRKYLAARGEGFERRAASKILTDSAPFLSDFVAKMFRIEAECSELEKEILVQNPVWRYKFFVQRRAIKRYKAEQIADLKEQELWIGLTELRNKGFDDTLVRDEELSIAEMTAKLLDAEEALTKDPNTDVKETL